MTEPGKRARSGRPEVSAAKAERAAGASVRTQIAGVIAGRAAAVDAAVKARQEAMAVKVDRAALRYRSYSSPEKLYRKHLRSRL